MSDAAETNNLEALWMPFTNNRQFKRRPRMLAGAKDMHYTAVDGRKILDGTAGLWCVNAGHCREPITAAIREQAGRLDFAPAFQMGHPLAFEFAAKLAAMLPGDLDHVFFANSGSGAVGTALEIAPAYHQASRQPTRPRLIRRARGSHGVRFGRLGAAFAADYFKVVPDLMTVAKGITNATVPMGAVFASKKIYDAFMKGPDGIELFHGYTYSGHPLAAAAGLATLKVYQDEGLFERAAALADYWQDAIHSLKGRPHVIDLRNLGLVGGIELESRPVKPGARAFDVFVDCFERGLLIRVTADIIALSPPLIVEKSHIDQMVDTIGESLRKAA